MISGSYREIKNLSRDLARLNKTSPKAQIVSANQASSTEMKKPLKNTKSAQPHGLALPSMCVSLPGPPPAPLACPPCSLQLCPQPLSQPTLKLMALLTRAVTHWKMPGEKALGWSHKDQGWMCHWKPGMPGTCLWGRDGSEGLLLTQQWQMVTAWKNIRKKMNESEKKSQSYKWEWVDGTGFSYFPLLHP